MGIGPAYGAPGSGEGVTDGDKGDVTVSSDGESWTIDHGTVTNAHLADVTGPALKGRQSGTGSPGDLTPAQVTALLNAFTTNLNGLVPAPDTATGKFLKDDGTWSSLPGLADDAVSNAKLANMAAATFKGRTAAGSGDPEDLSAAQATAMLNAFTATLKGLVPAPGTATGKYLKDDGTWATPSVADSRPDLRVDPAGLYFGPTGAVVESVASFISGEPFIVRDDANSQWVMYSFRTVTGAPYVRCYYKTLPYASGLSGSWSAATEMSTLAGYHKFVLLVDVDGAPVQVGGSYHGYAVSFSGTASTKVIYHFTSTSLIGPWTLGSNVLPKGASGSKDEFFTDTPYAVYKDGTIYLWYMGAPASSLATYSFAIRMLRASAANPDGPFTKDYTDILLPDTTNGVWDYGWLGGCQIRRRPNGKYMMVYNAGDTRSGSAGLEPNTSRVGYAYSDSIDGPWVKDGANPYLSPTGVPSDAVENANIWRGHLAYDHTRGAWSMFYNTGIGTEVITRADQGAYDYVYIPSPPIGNILLLTTGLQTVPNSRINLPAGRHRIVYQANLSDSGGTTPKLDIDTSVRVNGSIVRTTREFIGSYAYENRDVIFNLIITLASAGYVDLAVQVSSGTPTASTYIRRLRANANKIS